MTNSLKHFRHDLDRGNHFKISIIDIIHWLTVTSLVLPRMYLLSTTWHSTGSSTKSWLMVDRAGSTTKGMRKRNTEKEHIPEREESLSSHVSHGPGQDLPLTHDRRGEGGVEFQLFKTTWTLGLCWLLLLWHLFTDSPLKVWRSWVMIILKVWRSWVIIIIWKIRLFFNTAPP